MKTVAFLLSLLGAPAAALSQQMQMQWLRPFGTGGDLGAELAPAPGGGAYLGGYANSDLFGPTLGDVDAFVVRVDHQGDPVWGQRIGTSALDLGLAIASDESSVFLIGQTSGSLAPVVPTVRDGFVAAIGAAGQMVWVQQFGIDGWDNMRAAAADGAGGVFLLGRSDQHLFPPNWIWHGEFNARYSAGGQLLWGWQQPYTVETITYLDLLADGVGGYYMSGAASGNLYSPSNGNWDAIIERRDSGGNLLWGRQFGTALENEAGRMATDEADNIYIAASHSQTGTPQTSYLASYTASGEFRWQTALGVGRIGGIVPGGDGVLVAGSTHVPLFGPLNGTTDGFFARFNSAGTLEWGYQFSLGTYTGIRDMISDGFGGVFIGGTLGTTQSQLGRPFVARYHYAQSCYPNCDSSTLPPTLNIADFGCFLQKFAAQDPYANCDNSTIPPILNIADFGCFLQQFAAGCP